MNKYLEKIGGVQDWIDNVSGRKVNQTKSILEGLRHAAASGKSYSTYSDELKGLRNASTKARIQAGGVVVGAASAGLMGLQLYKDHQRNKILESYNNIYKQANIGTKIIGKVVGGLKATGHAVGDLTNTALGGKIKTYANDKGIVYGSAQMKEFNSGSHAEKLNMLKAKSINHKQLHEDFSKLTKDQTNARIVAGAIPTAGAIGYHKGKKNQASQPVYY